MVIFLILPANFPLALAAANPAFVRSRINSASNSASAAKMPNIRWPLAVVVSIWAPASASTLKPKPCLFRLSTILIKCFSYAPIYPVSKQPVYYQVVAPLNRPADLGDHLFVQKLNLYKSFPDQSRHQATHHATNSKHDSRRFLIHEYSRSAFYDSPCQKT